MSSQHGPDRHRWLISYADYMTLLCAFFIMLYALELMDQKTSKAVQDVLDGMFSVNAPQFLPNPPESVSPLDASNGLMPLYTEIKQQLQVYIDSDQLDVEIDGDWIRMRLPSDMLFSAGDWEISDVKMDQLAAVANIIRPIPNEINVEGHTDDVPVQTSAIVSNWDLSALRAVAVVRALELYGVAPQRMAAMGFGYQRPLVVNNSDDNRRANRRVEILIRQGDANQPWAREDSQQ